MTTKSPWALLPMFSFMALFIGSGLYYQAEGIEFAFYKISAPVAVSYTHLTLPTTPYV